MSSFRAQVRNGRLMLDEPTELPEGTVVELAQVDPYAELDGGDPFAQMSPEERAKLNAAIDKGLAEARAGLGRPIEDFLNEL